MTVLMPLFLFNIKLLDKLPEDLRTAIIAYTNLCNEKGIIPLIDSSPTDFDNNFSQAIKYFYNSMLQIGSLIISKYQNQGDIASNLNESFYEGLEMVRRDFSKLGKEAVVVLMIDAIDVIENYIKVSNMSTYTLDPYYYTEAFEAYVNVVVSMSTYWLAKTNERSLSDEIEKLLVQKLEDSTEILNELVKTIQIQEDNKAVIEGRHEYMEGKAKKFDNMDKISDMLESS